MGGVQRKSTEEPATGEEEAGLAQEKELMPRLRRKSLIFLIGDFFSLPDLNLLSKRHEVVVLVVRDRYEEKLPDMGECALLDPESSDYFEGSISKELKKRYEKRVAEMDRNMNEYFRKNRVRWIKLYTDEDPFAKLLRLFKE